MSFAFLNNKKMITIQRDLSKQPIVKGNCVFQQRSSLFCVGLLCKPSLSFSFVALKEMQCGLTSLFLHSSFSVEDCGLSPVNAAFIILEKPGAVGGEVP